MFKVSVGEKVKRLRLLKGMTQTDLARLVGYSRNSISNIENEIFSPTLTMAYNLSVALDCSLYDLMDIKEDEFFENWAEKVKM